MHAGGSDWLLIFSTHRGPSGVNAVDVRFADGESSGNSGEVVRKTLISH
jgi:hypothetical protein